MQSVITQWVQERSKQSPFSENLQSDQYTKVDSLVTQYTYYGIQAIGGTALPLVFCRREELGPWSAVPVFISLLLQ